jgi:hypothetical protein
MFVFKKQEQNKKAVKEAQVRFERSINAATGVISLAIPYADVLPGSCDCDASVFIFCGAEGRVSAPSLLCMLVGNSQSLVSYFRHADRF